MKQKRGVLEHVVRFEKAGDLFEPGDRCFFLKEKDGSGVLRDDKFVLAHVTKDGDIKDILGLVGFRDDFEIVATKLDVAEILRGW
jgi:hypothetical protein